MELSDEHDERDAFAWDHRPAQQNWTCVLDTGDLKVAPTLASFPVFKTEFVSKTAPQLKLADEPGETKLAVAEATIAEAQYRGVSRRQRYRGGNSIAEATVPRRQQYRGVSNGLVGLASLPWVGGPANIADFMTRNSHVLTQTRRP